MEYQCGRVVRMANSESLLIGDNYSKYKSAQNLKTINTRLALFASLDEYQRQSALITNEDLLEFSSDTYQNLEDYISQFVNFFQNQNPLIDLAKLKLTAQFIKANKNTDLFGLKFHHDLIPLVNLILICSCALLSKPLYLRAQSVYETSKEEKSASFSKSLKLFQLANQLQASLIHRIPDFDLNIIQFYLLCSTFYMLNMKPLQTWDLIHRSSVRIITSPS